MSESKIKTGFLGLSPNGKRLINLVEQLPRFTITAIGDKDIDNASKVAGRFQSCTGYDDYRQMIMQNELDLLFIAEPIYDSIEYIRSAIKKKLNIFKLHPAGRDFSESAELANLSAAEKVIFCVGNYWRKSSCWSSLADYINDKKIENPSFIEVQWRCPADIETDKSWLKDPKLAGGGVLLYDGYQAIDTIVSNFGIPEQVYALNISSAPDKQQRAYMTEDTSVVIMRFSESLTANLVFSRTFGPQEKNIKIYGKNHNIEIGENIFRSFDNMAVTEREFEFFDEPDALVRQALIDLAENIAPEDPEIKAPPICTISDNLGVMSVIEAVYLSAKTQMPEEPAKILNLGQSETGKGWLK